MWIKAVAPIIRKNSSPGPATCSILYGHCMLIAGCGALLPQKMVASISFPSITYLVVRCQQSYTWYLTIAMSTRFLPTRLDVSICSGVLVLAYSSDTTACTNAVILELIVIFLTSFRGSQALNAEAARSHHILHRSMESVEGVAIEPIGPHQLGVLVDFFSGVVVAPERF